MNPRPGSFFMSLTLVAAAGIAVYTLNSPSAKSQTPENPSQSRTMPSAHLGLAQSGSPAAGSAIQRELDALYARQGQSAPSLTPAAAAPNSAAANSVRPSISPLSHDGPSAGQAPTPRMPAQALPPAKSTSIWKRLLPWGRKNTSQPKPTKPTSRSARPVAEYGRLTFSNTVKGESDITGRPLGEPSRRNEFAPASVPAMSGPLSTPGGTMPQSAGTGAAQSSSIQQQLEELYRRDGREMPQMPGAAAPQQSAAVNPRATETRKPSFVRKLIPFLPYEQAATESSPPPQAAAASSASGDANTSDLDDGSRPRIFPGVRSLTPKQGSGSVAGSAPDQSEWSGGATVADVEPSQAIGGGLAHDDTAGDFTDPFTEVSEAEADKINRVNPFTGLTLDDEPVATSPASPDRTADASVDVNPFADTTAPATPLWQLEAQKNKKSAEISRTEPTAQSVPQVLPNASDKLQRIASRVDESGMKGFCPVALRDSRDLVDGKPEFTVYYKSNKIVMSSLDAQHKFEANPDLYAPALSGRDVILAADHQDDVDGSLEYALWYKDRLYLFHGPDTMAEFAESPSRYAITESSTGNQR